MPEIVLITGATRGLGFALAEKFLTEGWQVFAGMRFAPGQLQRLVERFPHLAGFVPLDVADLESVRRAVRYISKRVSRLDLLINNAGVFPSEGTASLEELDLADAHLHKTMDVNAFGPLRVTQQFLPLLEQGQRRLIVNISSESGSIADSRRKAQFAYCMSKAALNMQSKLLQNYLGPKGFHVLALHPGWVQTDMGGPNAAIPPAASAEGIFALATKPWQPLDEIFMDYTGKPLPW